MTRRMRWTSVVVFAAGVALTSARGAAAQMTVYVVRHAEKAAAPAGDPPLSPAGQARAKALVDSATHAGVRAIITTQFLRTKETAAPTALALGITPEVVPATSPRSIDDVVAAVRKHVGQTVLVVGHSNTVPEIIAKLGAEEPPAICDSEYDDLYVVKIGTDGKATVAHGHYGARTPVGANCAAMR
jgi:broad specificity phosphatase PhoE